MSELHNIIIIEFLVYEHCVCETVDVQLKVNKGMNENEFNIYHSMI